MATIAQHAESINPPTDRDAYRVFVRGLDEATRLLLFGVPADAVTFRCPTNGRVYLDESPHREGDYLWTRCYWCDTAGRVRGTDKDFDRDHGQPHMNPIVEVSDG